MNFKKTTILLIFIWFTPVAHSQNTNHIFYCEQFYPTNICDLELNNTAGWSVSLIGQQGVKPNLWYLYNIGNCLNNNFIWDCFSSCSGTIYSNAQEPENVCLFVGKYYGNGLSTDTARLGAVYNKGCENLTHKRAESPTISCPFSKDLKLEFDFIGVGDLCGNDVCKLRYLINNTLPWQNLNPCLVTPLVGGNPVWQHYSQIIPGTNTVGSRTIQIGFEWINDTSCTGHKHSFAVDNIKISGNSLCPDVSFTVEPSTGYCINPPETLTFTNTSQPNNSISSILWDLGDGTTSNSQTTLQHVFTVPPTDSVRLTVTNNNGCTSSHAMYVPFSTGAPSMSSSPCINITPGSMANVFNLDFGNCVIAPGWTVFVRIPQLQLNMLMPSGPLSVYFPSSGNYNIELLLENNCGQYSFHQVVQIII